MALIRTGGNSGGANTGAVVAFLHTGNDYAWGVVSDLISKEVVNGGNKVNAVSTANSQHVTLRVKCSSQASTTNSLIADFDGELYDMNGAKIKDFTANAEIIDNSFNPAATVNSNTIVMLIKK